MRFMGHTCNYTRRTGRLQLQEESPCSSRGAPAPVRGVPPKCCLQLALRVIMKYDRNFLVLDQWQERSRTAAINSSDLRSRSWFTLWLKTSAGLLPNWNRISSAASGIDLYLTSRLRIDWHWLTIKMLSSSPRCRPTFGKRCTVVLSSLTNLRGDAAPPTYKQCILMLL